MVPKLFKSGKSFKTLAAYLLHDADKAKTADRVRWTHTLNLASDDPGLAVDEMLWTYRGADELKRQAGVRAGGRPLDNPVRHFSLNWHPSENPSREHMIEATENFLAHMGWGEHQALITNHTDKSHAHVHVMCSAVNPNTGCALDSSFEKRRAQEWAAAYEREHQLIFCEERLKPVEQRTPSPTRETWEKLRKSERDYFRVEVERVAKDFAEVEREVVRTPQTKEWDTLKTYQRRERERFFMDGKEAYRAVRNEVFREVREEFREEWRGYFEAKRENLDKDEVARMKAGILERQNAVLDARRKEACTSLREQRDDEYKAQLAQQQVHRAELGLRHREGLPTESFLHMITIEAEESARDGVRGMPYPRRSVEKTKAGFRRAADETTKPPHGSARQQRKLAAFASEPSEKPLRVRNGLDAVGGIGLGALGAIATIGERLFDGFFGGEAEPIAPPLQERSSPDETRREDAARATSVQASVESRAAEEAALLASWEDRRHRRRARE